MLPAKTTMRSERIARRNGFWKERVGWKTGIEADGKSRSDEIRDIQRRKRKGGNTLEGESVEERGKARSGWQFLPKKWSLLNFFQARGGRLAKFSSVGESRQLPRRGKPRTWVEYKEAFWKKYLIVVRLPLITLLRKELPPKGKPWKEEEIWIDLYRLLTQTLSPLP